MAFLAINKDWHAEQSMWIPEAARGRRVMRICRGSAADDAAPDKADNGGVLHADSELAGESLRLQPSEIVYLL